MVKAVFAKPLPYLWQRSSLISVKGIMPLTFIKGVTKVYQRWSNVMSKVPLFRVKSVIPLTRVKSLSMAMSKDLLTFDICVKDSHPHLSHL